MCYCQRAIYSTDILSRLRNIENVFRFINKTTFRYISAAVTPNSLSVGDEISALLRTIDEGTSQVSEGETTPASIFTTDATDLTKSDSNVGLVDTIQRTIVPYIDSIMDVVIDTLAPLIGLTSSKLFEVLEAPHIPAQFPQSCIIDDIAYTRDLEIAIKNGINEYSELAKAQIEAL